jgi:hypothetical protein
MMGRSRLDLGQPLRDLARQKGSLVDACKLLQFADPPGVDRGRFDVAHRRDQFAVPANADGNMFRRRIDGLHFEVQLGRHRLHKFAGADSGAPSTQHRGAEPQQHLDGVGHRCVVLIGGRCHTRRRSLHDATRLSAMNARLDGGYHIIDSMRGYSAAFCPWP